MFTHPYKHEWYKVCILLCLASSACTSSTKPQIQVKALKHLGGSFTAACVTEDEIHLRSYYRFLSLKHQNARLRLKEETRLAQLNVADSSNTITTESLHTQPKVTANFQVKIKVFDPCPYPEAWVKLNSKSRLSMKWQGQDLLLSPQQWRWGNEQREQLTQLNDIAPMSFNRKTQETRYLIASNAGVWVWNSTQKAARRLSLPPNIPHNIFALAKDQDAWWLSTESGVHQRLWPIHFNTVKAKLISTPIKQKLNSNKQLLAPLSGTVLKAKKDGLVLQWGRQRYPFNAVQSLCVLSKRMVALATKEELVIILGPKLEKAKSNQEEAQLQMIQRIALPTNTKQLLCEKDAIIALGEGYGLLRFELNLLTQPNGIE